MKMKSINRCLGVLINTRQLCGLALGAAIAFGSSTSARSQSQPAAGGASATTGPTPAERALGLLKPVADKLSSAKAFRFKIESMVEVPSPVGQMIDYFFNTEVEAERPNKIFARKRGDGPAFDVYCDGNRRGLHLGVDAFPSRLRSVGSHDVFPDTSQPIVEQGVIP